MPKVTWIRQCSVDAPRASLRRERASIDLRGHAPMLNAVARSMNMSASALVRTVLVQWVQTHGVDGGDHLALVATQDSPQRDASIIKVTLRLPTDSAAKLTLGAHSAEVSQGAYVARLLDGHPPGPVAPDQRESRAELIRSTATLAAMSTDLHAFMRAMRQGASPEVSSCSAMLAQLSDAVLQHLNSGAALLAALAASRHSAAADPD